MYLNSVIGEFQGISLGQMDSVKLMNRTDRKYWFKLSCYGVYTIVEEVDDTVIDYQFSDGSGNLYKPD